MFSGEPRSYHLLLQNLKWHIPCNCFKMVWVYQKNLIAHFFQDSLFATCPHWSFFLCFSKFIIMIIPSINTFSKYNPKKKNGVQEVWSFFSFFFFSTRFKYSREFSTFVETKKLVKPLFKWCHGRPWSLWWRDKIFHMLLVLWVNSWILLVIAIMMLWLES